MKNKILIIAGSDSCGGAGVQADIKTATSLKTYCASAISCLTAQNSQKVFDISYPPIDFVAKQIAAVIEDIKIDAIKIGMLGNSQITNEVTKILEEKAKNIPIITDPVMVSTSGDILFKKDALESLKKLISHSFLTTPNIPEAEILSAMKINNLEDVKIAARKIKEIGVKNVLIKGGHLDSKDKIFNFLLKEDGTEKTFTNKKLDLGEIHGTGCTLATAIACFISQGFELENSFKKATSFVLKTIRNSQKIGKGSRILKHY
ncbi:MAG: hydroxymethylpyrimidine/phosphomethylpyrimidine kinase [Myxococcota bacterium]|jgi:hydroxymethylpyrimidine/phosphomethylpyrimidine kinase